MGIHLLQSGVFGAVVPEICPARPLWPRHPVLCAGRAEGYQGLALLGQASLGYTVLGHRVRLAGMGYFFQALALSCCHINAQSRRPRHFIIGLPVQFTPCSFFALAAPLLEEKGNICRAALLKNALYPLPLD